MAILGVHCTREALVMSDGVQTENGDRDWIEWLLRTSTFDDKVAYDLDYLVAQALAHSYAMEVECRKLLTEHRAHLRSGHTLFYIPGRVLSISHGYQGAKRYTTIYNGKQYNDAVRHDPETTVEEARKCAAQAQGIGQDVRRSYEAIGITHSSLTSPVKAFDASGLWPDVPTIDAIPEGAGELAYESVKGNWVEAFQLGHWERAYDYDINGAYASELALLQDLREGEWVEADKIPEGAVYGFAKGLIETPAPFHPYLVKGKNDVSYTPVGSWETYLTLQEILFLQRNSLGHFLIREGWWWIPRHVKYPFHETVMRLWGIRRANEGMVSAICKRILAGMWGKMLELRGSQAAPEFGPHFNPVYGAIVEANVRLRVVQACIDNGVVPLHVAVDGMITDRPLERVIVNTNLGGWRLSHVGKCIIAGSGIVGMEGKSGDEEFALSYEWLKGMFAVYPGQREYSKVKWSPVSVAKALNEEGGWERLGKLEQITRTVVVGEEVKRFYAKQPKCGRDVLSNQYAGQPWSSSVVLAVPLA